MSVVLAMEEVGPCRRELRIEVPQPAVEAETARVTGEYGRRARIPGFRKGKVPAELVRRHFGKEIEQEVLERLLPRYWRQAAAEKSLEPLAPPRGGEGGLPRRRVARSSPPWSRSGRRSSCATTVTSRCPKPRSSRRRTRSSAPSTTCGATTPSGCRSSARRRAGTSCAARSRSSFPAPGPRPGRPRRRSSSSARPASGRSSEPRRPASRPGRAPASPAVRARARRRATARSSCGCSRSRRLACRSSRRVRPPLRQLRERRDVPRRRLPPPARGQAGRSPRPSRVGDARPARRAPPDAAPRGRRAPRDRGAAARIRRGPVPARRRPGEGRRSTGRTWASRRSRTPSGVSRPGSCSTRSSEKESIQVGEDEFEQALAVLARVQGVATQALRQRLDGAGELAGLRGSDAAREDDPVPARRADPERPRAAGRAGRARGGFRAFRASGD